MRSRIALIAVAAVLALAPIPAPAVEAWYSTRAYPVWQSIATACSNRSPFALFDAAIAALVVWAVWGAVRDFGQHGRGWLSRAGRFLLRAAAAGALVYIAFLAAWGLNYRRVPLVDKLPFDAQLVTADRARDLAIRIVASLNALHHAAHVAGPGVASIDPDLAVAFAEAETLAGSHTAAVVGRPKRSVLDAYFKAAGIDGMTDPFLLETLVVSDLLPFERPLVVAHEWSHLAGFADESEASFIGWLACVHGTPAAQYSGWLFLYDEIARSLPPRDRAEAAAALAAGPREDLEAITARLRRDVKPIVFAGAWQTYDRYLKANRVQAGVASYGQVVRLVLGTRFTDDWRPER